VSEDIRYMGRLFSTVEPPPRHEGIIELDGPPRAYFEIPCCLPTGEIFISRHVYKMLRLKSKDKRNLEAKLAEQLGSDSRQT
jgi:hypothetical protein